MSHELRTPLSAIIGAAELLSKAELDTRSRTIVQTISDASEALFALINSVLDFSKIEAGKMELQLAPFETDAVVEGAAEVAAHLARQKGIALHAYVDPAIPALTGDRDRLRQILLNLLANAVKFADRGVVIVRAQLLAEDAERVTLHFDVEDSGIGIAPDVIPTLFEPFAQADRTASRRFGGTGLGLSISKRLVELMGGEIGVRSELGSGSSFWFIVPFERAGAAREPRRLPSHITALIVSGDDAFADITARYLRSWSMATRRVSGKAELQQLLSADGRQTIAIVDVADAGFAEGDGANDALSGLDRSRIIAIGTDEGLRKPIRQSQLFDAIAGTPAIQTVPPHPRPQPPAAGRANGPARSSRHMLVAEDNAQLQTLLQLQFDELGIDVTFVSDGRQALDALAAGHFDMVFMDCQMPNLDGLEATRRIRSGERISGGHVPIAAMTANAFAEDRDECLAAGMDDYLPKPVKLDDLRAMMERWATPAR
jgi:CheY-like chemotaxis protein